MPVQKTLVSDQDLRNIMRQIQLQWERGDRQRWMKTNRIHSSTVSSIMLGKMQPTRSFARALGFRPVRGWESFGDKK